MTTRPIDIEDIYQLTLVGDAQISPDGTRVAYVVRRLDREQNDYVSSIYLWDGHESRQFTAGGKDSAPRWSPDGATLAFLSKRGEKAQIYLMSTAGGEARALTESPNGAGTPIWSPDGTRIAYVSGVPTEESEGETARTRVIDRAIYKSDGTGFVHDRRRHLFVVDVACGEVTQVTEGDCNDGAPVWSPDGRHLAFAANRNPEWDIERTSDIWLVPSRGGTPRRVTSGDGTWSDPVFSPDGTQIAMTGYPRPEGEKPSYYDQLWTVPTGGGTPRNVLEGTDLAPGNSLAADWHSGGDGSARWVESGLYFLVSERGTTNIYRWTDTVQKVTSGRHDIIDFSVAGKALACTVSDATHPNEIALVEDGCLRPVTTHNAAFLQTAPPTAPEKITFSGSNGVEIDGWLLKPATYVEGQKYPLIVYIHGGPVSAYGETFFHEFQALAGQGFGVFYCNPHGGSSYGRAFQTSIIGAWGTLDYHDMMAGVDRVLQEPWVDVHRLGVAGGSYGGFMTNWIIGHTDRFAAAATQRSICNMVSQGGTSDIAAGRGERMQATPEGDPERLWNMSPLKYAANVKTPTLILHSERDDRCPIEEGEQWFSALRRQRVPVRFVRFPEESHGLSRGGKPSRRVERMQHIAGWFKTYL